MSIYTCMRLKLSLGPIISVNFFLVTYVLKTDLYYFKLLNLPFGSSFRFFVIHLGLSNYCAFVTYIKSTKNLNSRIISR